MIARTCRWWLPLAIVTCLVLNDFPQLASELYLNIGLVVYARSFGQPGTRWTALQAADLLQHSAVDGNLHPRAAFWLGRMAYVAGNLDVASQYLTMATQMRPNDLDAQFLLACSHDRSGRYSMAVEPLTQVMSTMQGNQTLREASVVELLLSGVEAFSAGNQIFAKQEFLRVSELSPNDLIAHYYLWLMDQPYTGDSGFPVKSTRFIFDVRLMKPLSATYDEMKRSSMRRLGEESSAGNPLLWLGHLLEGTWQPSENDDRPISKLCRLYSDPSWQFSPGTSSGSDEDLVLQRAALTSLARHSDLADYLIGLGPNLVSNGNFQDSRYGPDGWRWFEWIRKGGRGLIFGDGFFVGFVSPRSPDSTDRILVITGLWMETTGGGQETYVGYFSSPFQLEANTTYLVSFEYNSRLVDGGGAVSLQGAPSLLIDALGSTQLPGTQGQWRRVNALVRTGSEETLYASILFNSGSLGQIAFDNVQVRQIHGLPIDIQPAAWFDIP